MKREEDRKRALLTAKRTKDFNAVRFEIPGAFVFKKNRNPEDFTRKYLTHVPEKHFKLTHGLIVVQDAKSKEVVLVVRFVPFTKVSPEEFAEYQEVTCTLMKMAKTGRKVKRNGPQVSGSCKDLKMGRYYPDGPIQKSTSKLLEWEQQQTLSSKIASFYRKKFCGLAPMLFKRTKMEALKSGVPSLSETEFNLLHVEEEAFCSNLTFTVDNFNNRLHQDNDFQTYTFGIFAPICSKTGTLFSVGNEPNISRGEFVLRSYNTYIDFNACDGIIEVIWRGSSNFYSTLPGETPMNRTRFGSSVQISNTLVARMKKVLDLYSKGVDVNDHVIGVKEIVESKLRSLNKAHK